MDANEYPLHYMVRERLETDRQPDRRAVLLAGARGRRRRTGLRAALGLRLIRLGSALLAEADRPPRHA